MAAVSVHSMRLGGCGLVVIRSRCFAVRNSSLRAILNDRVENLLEQLQAELWTLPLFAVKSQTAWHDRERQRFADALAQSYCKDNLLPVLLDKLSTSRQLVATVEMECTSDISRLLERIRPAMGDNEVPPFAKAFLKVPKKVLGGGHRGRQVVRAEQLAAALALSRIRAAELLALAELFQALGVPKDDATSLRQPVAYEEALSELLEAPDVTGELQAGVAMSAESGFLFATRRQLLLWKQLGDYTFAEE
eukprot:TRINITY_DN22272_c0_g1_i1.p1 TRINITY_DN22272_c0_g1~~TRINITY_DN22272_c0_g1_i1.p1  ORF type:complete len:249 (-),score=42.47 TRINITY_DN22272_c0_g1_i1:315-1061(-)